MSHIGWVGRVAPPFPPKRVLTIASGKSLTIPGSVTLTDNGTINVESGGTVTGTVTGNQPVQQ